MLTRTHLRFTAALLALAASACSHAGSSTTDGSSGQKSDRSKYAKKSPIKSQDAPERGYSCHHYDPLTNAIYTGAGSADRLKGSPTDAFRREYVERMLHGVYHAKFDLPTTPVSNAELTDKEIAYHRRAITDYLRKQSGLFE